MALAATMLWEVRTTGSQTNGGGWKPGATGTDYSQQNAAQYALTGVTTAAADAICLSASAAADMVGNTCRIVSGTNFTVGWYEIISVVAGVSFTLDRNCTYAAGALGVINIGGAFLIGGTLDNAFFTSNQKVAGNTIYIKAGTYTLVDSIVAYVAGTSLLPITIEGYNAVRGDTPVGTSRPLFVGGTYYNFDTAENFYIVRNLRGTTAGGNAALRIGGYSTIYNCKGTNTRTSSASTSSRGIGTGDNCAVIACEASATMGVAINIGAYSTIIGCYVHDSAYGLYGGSYSTRIGNVIDTCQNGIDITGTNYTFNYNNTVRNCLNGIYGTTGANNNFINNIIADCVTGASWVSNYLINFWDYNCWSNNGTDVSNVTKGLHDVTADALLTSATVKGTDGATSAGGTVFTAASNPFGSVTTSDCLNIVEIGTGATLGVYTIVSVDGVGQLTIDRTAGASKTGITYCIVKGTDFTLAVGSPCFNTGLKLGTNVGL